MIMPQQHQKVWMYFETDGDAGYYIIRLFTTQEKAEAYKQSRPEVERAYGKVQEVLVY
jgi:hypothetical protein